VANKKASPRRKKPTSRNLKMADVAVNEARQREATVYEPSLADVSVAAHAAVRKLRLIKLVAGVLVGGVVSSAVVAYKRVDREDSKAKPVAESTGQSAVQFCFNGDCNQSVGESGQSKPTDSVSVWKPKPDPNVPPIALNNVTQSDLALLSKKVATLNDKVSKLETKVEDARNDRAQTRKNRDQVKNGLKILQAPMEQSNDTLLSDGTKLSASSKRSPANGKNSHRIHKGHVATP
jgi:hypothetical protein